jgi:hypothetical protein
MIHHFSIAAQDPETVGRGFVELFGGKLTRGPFEGSYMAWMDDEYGTAVEVYRVGGEFVLDEVALETEKSGYRENSNPSPHTATHAAISVARREDEILELARRLGWHASKKNRGGFDVIELWVENRVMLEILTAEMAADYLKASTSVLSDPQYLIAST